MNRVSRLFEVLSPVILVLAASAALAQTPAPEPTHALRLAPATRVDGTSGATAQLASPPLPPGVVGSKWFSIGPFAGIELTGSSHTSGPRPAILAGVLWLHQAGTWQRVYLEPPRQGTGAVPAR